jgi:ubiquinone biosynthesis protein
MSLETASEKSTSTPAPQSRRRRRSRRHRRERSPRVQGLGNELRAWAKVLDGVLSAIEETAWSARHVADVARERLRHGERDLKSAREDWSLLPEQATRLTQTGFMLARMAAGYRLHGLRAAFVSSERADELLAELHEKSARRFHDVSAVHGGAFLKVGQLLSARPDLLPAVWIRELEQLQDAAPPIGFDLVRGVVESEFGRSIGEVFRSFDETPIAAASIGQVHRAVTVDGRHVAVKVKRPGIDARVKADLEMLEAFIASLESSLPETDYDTIVSEVRRAVVGELDYVAEAQTTRTISDFFANHGEIVAPSPVPELCTERVLTTTFIEGRKITVVLDELAHRAAEGDPSARGKLSAVLGNLLEAYLRQVLEAGVFQADPHPGNLLVTREGKVVVLDFGCSEVLSPETRGRYLALMGAFMTGDRDRMAQLFSEIGFSTRSGRPDTLHEFADALLTEIRDASLSGGVRWPTRDQAVARMTALLHACEDDPVVTLPGEFIMIARVFGTLGGQFARYEPDLDFARHVLPVLGPAMVASVFG